MSPILPAARPFWVRPLLAFATILAIFWYRRKRGSLKTDRGDADKTQIDGKSVESDEEAKVSEISVLESSAIENVVENQKGDEVEKINHNHHHHHHRRRRQSNLNESVPTVDSIFGQTEEMINSPAKLNESNSSPVQNDGENDSCVLEKKLSKLDLRSDSDSGKTDEKQENNSDLGERDSANNSPLEVMLAITSVRGYSDTHSEGSSDSGKGCSEMLTPSRTPVSGNSVSGDAQVTSVYEFVIPQHLVGRLIGRHGSYVTEIKERTHASLYIKRHPNTPTLKICAIEGAQMDIESALDMIKQKFPKKYYPNFTLEQIVTVPKPQVIPIMMQLYLIEGINNDVLLSSLVSAGHFFLQHPTHPTYLSLSRLNACMNFCYSEPHQPTIPEGVGAGILCAAPFQNGWYRAQITSMDEENKICEVKLVDYGDFMTMPVSMLRQIRFDFVNLPFQATECYLANVKPSNEENFWCEEAKKLVETLSFGKVLQAQVCGYAEDGVPLIYLYTVVEDKVVLINEELVNLGLAEWISVDSKKITECEMDGSAPMTVSV